MNKLGLSIVLLAVVCALAAPMQAVAGSLNYERNAAARQATLCYCTGYGYDVGDRVELLVNNPDGHPTLFAGMTGTVICDALGYPPVLVSWDGWQEGHDGNGYCECPPTALPDTSGWYVECDHIQLIGPGTWPAVYAQIVSSPGDLDVLRAFRDQVLKENAATEKLVERLYDRSHEVALALLMDEELMAAGADLLAKVKPAVARRLGKGSVTVSAEVVAEAQALLGVLAVDASDELAALIADADALLGDAAALRSLGIRVR
jgi:hypothetical protein